jgi:pimeloyl-ACP methyl ester carboxylesterase
MSEIIINDLIVNYQKIGSGDADFIFLHGWGCDLNIFNKLIQKIDKNKYTIYVLDFPAFGKSQMPKDVYGAGEYARFLKEFINKLEIKNPIILGHSFGGRVAIKFASDYPDITGKLILTGSEGIKKDLKKSYLVIAKVGKLFFSLPFLKKYKNRILEKIGAKDLAQSGEREKIFRKVVNEDLRDDAKKIDAPTLLIYGINDKETPIEYGEIFNKLIPNSKLEIIKNAGHYVFLDQEEKFLEKVNSFLS